MVRNELSFCFSAQEIIKDRLATLWIGGEGNLINIKKVFKGLDIGMV